MLETKKANLLDVIEVVEDLPAYNIKKGERGTVVEVFNDPEDAYMVEFVDESGTSSRIADWVKPEQIKGTEEIAQQDFELGMSFLNKGDLMNAERMFQKAIELKSSYLSILHNMIVKSFEECNDWLWAIKTMETVRRLAPDYEYARDNLAIAFQKYGIQKLNNGELDAALDVFSLAISLAPSPEIISDTQNNLSVVFTSLGIQEHQQGNWFNAFRWMEQANAINPTEATRHNLAIAYISRALDYMEKEQFKEAIHAFERAELAGIVRPELLNDYGVALTMLDRFDEATRAFERALHLLPENEAIKSNLATIKEKELKGDLIRVLSQKDIQADFEVVFSSQQPFNLAA